MKIHHFRKMIFLILVIPALLLSSCRSLPAVYPGAVENTQGEFSRLDIGCLQTIWVDLGKTGGTVKIDGTVYRSADPIETVQTWYLEKYPGVTGINRCGHVTVYLLPAGCSSPAENCTSLVMLFTTNDSGTWIGTYWRK